MSTRRISRLEPAFADIPFGGGTERPRGRWRPARWRWAWVVSALLHLAALLVVLFGIRPRTPPRTETPPGVAVVFESPGARRPAVPEPSPAPPKPGPPAPAMEPGRPVPPPPDASPLPAQPGPALPIPPVPVVPAPPPSAAPSSAGTAPEVNLSPLSRTLPLPPPVPLPAAPPLPAPTVPRARPARPRVNALDGYGIPLAGRWAPGGRPSGSQGHAERGPLSIAPPAAALSAEDAPAGWLNALGDWIQRHDYYPREAAENHQQGDVTVAVDVDRSGKVLSVRLERRSGSPFLDMALLSVFRDQRVPPFPGAEGPPRITVHVTISYVLVDH